MVKRKVNMPQPKECLIMEVMRKNRKSWAINPKTRVVPNKKKKTKAQKYKYDLGDEYLF